MALILQYSAPTRTQAETEALIAEANHQIANNLSVIGCMVRMHASSAAKIADPMPAKDVQLLLEEVALRIAAVGKLHRCIAQARNSANVALAPYLYDISKSIMACLSLAGRGRLTFKSASDFIVPGRDALSIGFVVSELLTNAIKYSHPAGVSGNFIVSCERVGDFITVEVADDGVGMPDGFNPKTDGGLGLRLVRALADQLRAELVFVNTGVGLSVGLRMEHVQAREAQMPPEFETPVEQRHGA